MWKIKTRSEDVSNTEAQTEAGSWNLFFSLFPTYANKSRRYLNTLGFKASKERTKQNDTLIV